MSPKTGIYSLGGVFAVMLIVIVVLTSGCTDQGLVNQTQNNSPAEPQEPTNTYGSNSADYHYAISRIVKCPMCHQSDKVYPERYGYYCQREGCAFAVTM